MPKEQKKNKGGRPVGWRKDSPEEIEKHIEHVFKRMAEGVSVRKACAEINIEESVFRYRVMHDDVNRERYLGLRAIHADMYVEDLFDLIEQVKKGSLTPLQARFVADNLKWIACKTAPKMYGERVNVNHGSDDGSMSPKPVSIDLTSLTTKELLELVKHSETEEEEN